MSEVPLHLAHKKQHPPCDNNRALRIGLLYGPRGGLFLVSEVPLKNSPDSSMCSKHFRTTGVPRSQNIAPH